ncbi:TIGR00730 family Rossman fold protein [Rubricoccus marinus]|nr:TIGR00730 family Rossman fold protein [Rubricoccus marinus]
MSTDNRQPTPFDASKEMTPEEMMAWQQMRVKETWQVFRVMSEFVEGYERMGQCGPSVSVFGSARTPPDHPYYEMGVTVGRKLSERGYAVITGGGPGIMQAANQGAQEAGGVSIGLNIVLPHEQSANPYVDATGLLNFDFFFARKVMFVKYAQGFVVLPGGFGTMDELFESLTLIQTHKTARFPVVLMGTEYWSGLLDWIDGTLKAGGFISPEDTDLFTLTDDPDEAVAIIDRYSEQSGILPNF